MFKIPNAAHPESLSPSSLKMFLSCHRKYFYKKVAQVAPDADAVVDTRPFQIGKAFHRLLEDHNHDLAGVGLDRVLETCKEFGVEGDEAIMIAAMLSKYKDMHLKAGLKVIACEMELKTPTFHGFIDVILGDKKGWWIADMKTAASFNPSMLATLPSDVQLNLYAAHADLVAERYRLPLKNFKGVRYRLTTKSRLIRKSTEAVKPYFDRVRGAVKSVDFAIPAEILKTSDVLSIHEEALGFIMGRAAESQYGKNPGNCMNYNKPCEYWSHCHGFEFTAAPALVAIEAE